MLLAVYFCGCGETEAPVSEEGANNTVEASASVAEENVSAEAPEEETPAEKAPEKEAPAPEKEEVPVEEAPAPEVDLERVLDAIISGVGANDPLVIPAERLSDLYGIDSSLVKQAASYVTIEGAFPDEIVIVEAVSEKDAETIAILLENRLSEVKEQSKSYDPENYALAQQCTVGRKGCFVSMFLAPEHAKMNEIFNRYVK